MNRYPREVPPLPWYRTTVPQMMMAGFLPFSAIYIELYYIFASVWGHKVPLRCLGTGLCACCPSHSYCAALVLTRLPARACLCCECFLCANGCSLTRQPRIHDCFVN